MNTPDTPSDHRHDTAWLDNLTVDSCPGCGSPRIQVPQCDGLTGIDRTATNASVSEYERGALQTEAPITPELLQRLCRSARAIHGLIGLMTEIGELADAFKKHVFYGRQLDNTNACEELGDLTWYQALLADFLGTTLGAEQTRNLAKLQARFPQRFTEWHATTRNLDQERSVLEGAAVQTLKTGDQPGQPEAGVGPSTSSGPAADDKTEPGCWRQFDDLERNGTSRRILGLVNNDGVRHIRLSGEAHWYTPELLYRRGYRLKQTTQSQPSGNSGELPAEPAECPECNGEGVVEW